jgi:hypothetical protein
MADTAPEKKNGSKSTGQKVSFDTSNLKSSYANVCTMNSTREEVVLNFGLNQSWERSADTVTIELNNRIILSPFAAQRLHDMLEKLLGEYRSRYGDIKSGDPSQ